MGIQRYMFFSIYNCDKYPEVPLMKIKSCTEKFVQVRPPARSSNRHRQADDGSPITL